ncbi:MAG: hypothetical protein GWO07_06115 [Candidatus Dadabacteria bacterium]|nr:hypothetical protein [Candidatus Dadabacteria bacterium]NIS08327.1 hypothetical protein [Candidatus Dadabacteria bacterium]NIV41751.1 hypothetical protein [Candidatus Dadabacteria bacterium]NIX15199.1 hypothetical protein [Candidatus Dadabacteria bacterium]NIY21844.1 hypothetical protein [Candidatus Dadabacteria bacterium]
MARSVFILLITGLFFNITAAYSQSLETKEFCAIYSDNKRVGFNKTTYKTDGDVLTIREYSKLKVILLGAENDMEINSKYILKKGSLMSFEFKMSSVGLNVETKGKRDGNKMFFKTSTVSGQSEFSQEIVNEPVVTSYLHKWIVNNGLTAGKEYKVHIFEASMLLMGSKLEDLTADIKVIGKENIEIPSGSYDAYKYTVNFNDSVSSIWITEDGELLKDESSLGLVAIREKEEDVRDQNLSRVDIIEKTAISASKTIYSPRKLDRLEVRLSGLKSLDEFNLNDRYRQFLNDDLLLIKTENIDLFKDLEAIPNKESVTKLYSQPTNLIQSDDENIMNLSTNIVGKTKNPIDKVRLINSWVYSSLDKKPTISIPNALDVLLTKTGDCNEHSVLFAALTRASGIPTKIILGIVYLDGKFYYHAWNEVFLGKWVSVDSTLNQLPVDASHIKFLEGDISRSSEIMKLVGKLNLEIIDAS